MCKNANGSEAMANMMVEHQRFLEECERRLQKAKATATANRVAIEEIAEDIEKMTTEVTAMNTMAHENSKTTNDYLNEWEAYLAELDDYYDDWEDPAEGEDYPEDSYEGENYHDEWEAYLEEWYAAEEKQAWEDYLEERAYENSVEDQFDGDFPQNKSKTYMSWRQYEYMTNIRSFPNNKVEVSKAIKPVEEESTDPLWDCWYDVAGEYEPDSEKSAKEETEDTYQEIYEEIFDMAGITIEDFLAGEIYFCAKLIQHGQVAKRRKKTYWHGRRLQRNALVIGKNYKKRWERYSFLYRDMPSKLIRTQRIMKEAEKKGWVKIALK